MSPFRFRLQKVLDLSDWREQEQAIFAEQARGEAEKAHRAMELLQQLRNETRERMERAHSSGGRAGEITNLRFVLEQLDARVEQARTSHEQANHRLDECMDMLAAAVRERQTLQRLRDRQQQADHLARSNRDRRELDEIASIRSAVGQTAFGSAGA